MKHDHFHGENPFEDYMKKIQEEKAALKKLKKDK